MKGRGARLSPGLVAAAVGAVFFPGAVSGYSLTGKSWPAGTSVVLQLSLGASPLPLLDGNTSWNAAVAPVVEIWNEKTDRLRVSGVMDSPLPSSSGDGINSVVFTNSIFGDSFSKGTLAVAYSMTQGSRITEVDLLFNKAQAFNSYTGPLKFGADRYAIADIRRVFIHELGHGIGLGHPDAGGQEVDAIMNSVTSDRETLSNDDIAGAQSLYGAPTNSTPTPAPTPTPFPSATPTPTPPTGQSRLVNISTRMKVGSGEDVLIGGFIVTGTQQKKLILRAIGPSLIAGGISGALQDPTLELYDSAGTVIGANDDWQEGGQVSEINASGIAPRNSAEAALVANLAPGSYTAMVRGYEETAGIALVEGYELDSTKTRLLNLSTRGRIGAGENALIGGLIIKGNIGKRVIIRALGPSLGIGPGQVQGALANPVLELRDGAGNLVMANDDWASGAQKAEIIATSVPPAHPLESAVVATLPPGNYTAVVRGANNQTGVGLVEIFDLDP